MSKPDKRQPSSIIRIDKKQRLTSSFADKANQQITTTEIATTIQDFIANNLSTEGSTLREQVYPCIAQLTADLLARQLGPAAALMFASEGTRSILISGVLSGFYLYHMMKQQGLKINILKESLTDEEIAQELKQSNLETLAIMAALQGITPEALLQELHARGYLSDEDLSRFEVSAKKVSQPN